MVPNDSPPPPDDAGQDDDIAEMAAAFGIPYYKGMPLANLIWLTFAHRVRSLPRPFGIEYRHVHPVDSRLPGDRAHHRHVDWLMRISEWPITSDQLIPDPESTAWVYLGHVEFESWVRVGELGARLWVYHELIHDTWGLNVTLVQKVVDTADDDRPDGQHADIPTPPLTNSSRYTVPRLRPFDCDPTRLDPADQESLLGQIVMLHMAGGARPERLDAIMAQIRRIPDPHLRWQNMKFLLYNVISYRRIRRIFTQRMRQAIAEGDEAMLLTPQEREWVAQRQIDFIDETEDDVLARSERFRQQFAAGRMEGRMEGRTEGQKEGWQEGRKDERIASLLATLRQRDMPLSAPMQHMLEQLPFEQLPPLELAFTASSVAEFAQRAGLINGHQLD